MCSAPSRGRETKDGRGGKNRGTWVSKAVIAESTLRAFAFLLFFLVPASLDLLISIIMIVALDPQSRRGGM